MKHQAKVIFFIKATPEQVWEGITNPEIVKQYFFGTDLSADWKVGGNIYFRGEWEGKPYEDKGIIQAIELNKHLSYLYKSSWDPSPDAIENYLLVTYDLQEKDGMTELLILQDAKNEEQARHSEENWKAVIGGMQKIIEKK